MLFLDIAKVTKQYSFKSSVALALYYTYLHMHSLRLQIDRCQHELGELRSYLASKYHTKSGFHPNSLHPGAESSEWTHDPRWLAFWRTCTGCMSIRIALREGAILPIPAREADMTLHFCAFYSVTCALCL